MSMTYLDLFRCNYSENSLADACPTNWQICLLTFTWIFSRLSNVSMWEGSGHIISLVVRKEGGTSVLICLLLFPKTVLIFLRIALKVNCINVWSSIRAVTKDHVSTATIASLPNIQHIFKFSKEVICIFVIDNLGIDFTSFFMVLKILLFFGYFWIVTISQIEVGG